MNIVYELFFDHSTKTLEKYFFRFIKTVAIEINTRHVTVINLHTCIKPTLRFTLKTYPAIRYHILFLCTVLGFDGSERAPWDRIHQEVYSEAEEVHQRAAGLTRHHPVH